MKKFLVSVSFVSLMSFEAHALKLYLLSNHNNAGDHNQVLGIADAFTKHSDEKVVTEDLDTKNLTSLEIKDKIAKDLANEKVVVLGAGQGGIDGLNEVSKRPNLTIALTSHMFLDQYKDKGLLEKINFIALPTHVTPDIKEELGPKLIETTGVAHNRRPDMTTYDEWKKELPPADIYLGVYLGGDASTPIKEIKHFTEEDALRLADYVIAKAKEIDACVLVLNGPRTGKYDANQQEIMTAHREGKSDHITELFANKLADNGVEYKIFDFQHNTPENKEWVSAYNAFDLVAGAVRTTKGKMIVPGESTSVISETIDIMPAEAGDTMPPGKAFVYHNSAMNDVHKGHVASELDAGRISVLENYQDIKVSAANMEAPKPSAAKVIAQKLVEVASAEEFIPEEIAPSKDEETPKAEKSPGNPSAEAAPSTEQPSNIKALPDAESPKTEAIPNAETAPNAEAAPSKEQSSNMELAPTSEATSNGEAPKAEKSPRAKTSSTGEAVPNNQKMPHVKMSE